jgi:hypothetical protein
MIARPSHIVVLRPQLQHYHRRGISATAQSQQLSSRSYDETLQTADRSIKYSVGTAVLWDPRLVFPLPR